MKSQSYFLPNRSTNMAGRHAEQSENDHGDDDISTSSDEETLSLNDELEDDEMSNSRVQDPAEAEPDDYDDDEYEEDPPKPEIIEIDPSKAPPEKDYYFEDDTSTIATFDTRHRFVNMAGPDQRSVGRSRHGNTDDRLQQYSQDQEAAYSEHQNRTMGMGQYGVNSQMALLQQASEMDDEGEQYGGQCDFDGGFEDSYQPINSGFPDIDRRAPIGRSRSFSNAFPPARQTQIMRSHSGLHRQMMQHPHMETLGETTSQNFQWGQPNGGGLGQSLHRNAHSAHQRTGLFPLQNFQHPMDIIGTPSHPRPRLSVDQIPVMPPQRSKSDHEATSFLRRPPQRSSSATEFGAYRNYNSLVAGVDTDGSRRQHDDDEEEPAGRRGWLARDISRRSIISNSSGGADPPGWESVNDMPGNIGGSDDSSSEESMSDFYDEDDESVKAEGSDSCSTTEDDDGSIDDIMKKLKQLKKNRSERPPSAKFVVSSGDIKHNEPIRKGSHHSQEKEKSQKKSKKGEKSTKKEKKESSSDLKDKDKKKKTKKKVGESCSVDGAEEADKKKKKESKKKKTKKEGKVSKKEEDKEGGKKKKKEGKHHKKDEPKKDDHKKDKKKEGSKDKKKVKDKKETSSKAPGTSDKISEHTDTTRSTLESDELSTEKRTYTFEESDVSGLVNKVGVWGDL